MVYEGKKAREGKGRNGRKGERRNKKNINR